MAKNEKVLAECKKRSSQNEFRFKFLQKETRTQRIWKGMVPGGGLEPPRLSTPDPKSGASTNSATRARILENALKKRQGQDFS